MLGPFAVGSLPSTPIVVDLAGEHGVLDLSLYDEVIVEGQDDTSLPDGTVEVLAGGKVRYTFLEPFAVAGTVCFRIKLSRTDGVVDYTPWIGFNVLDQMPTPMLTTTEAYYLTNEAVSQTALFKAQTIVGLMINRDLSDATWLAGLKARDRQRLRAAVAFQAAYERDGKGDMDLPPGIKSIIVGSRMGGQSITWQDGVTESDLMLAPLAKMALNKLSWLSGAKTLHAKPFGYQEGIDWNNNTIFGIHPVVRGPLPDEAYWTPLYETDV